MANQELGYLRDEMNQRLSVSPERVGKTVNSILLVWGGALAFLGYTLTHAQPATHIQFVIGTHFENIPNGSIDLMPPIVQNKCQLSGFVPGGTKSIPPVPNFDIPILILATIFFISNLVIYIMAQRYDHLRKGTFKLAAYLAVFHEKRPNGTPQVGENICWELVLFENAIKETGSATKHEQNFLKRCFSEQNCEYAALSLISTAFIGALLLVLIGVSLLPMTELATGDRISIFADSGALLVSATIMLVCSAYLIVSGYLLLGIANHTFLRDLNKVRAGYIHTFIEYSIDTGHSSRDELRNRLGDVIFDYASNPENWEEKQRVSRRTSLLGEK